MGKVACSGFVENLRGLLSLDYICWWDFWKLRYKGKFLVLWDCFKLLLGLNLCLGFLVGI